MRDSHLAQAIIEGTSDAIFVKDLEGRYLLVNQAAADFIGRPRDAILGRTDREWFHGATLPDLLDRDRQVMLQGRWETREETLTSNGTRTYSATKGPLRDEAGKTIGLVGISRDVTQQKQNEHRLATTAERLRQSNESLERFAHVVSHDLREPLRAMMMNLRRARKKLEAVGVEIVEDVLARAEAAGGRMNGLIEAVLGDATLAPPPRPFAWCEGDELVRSVLADLVPTVKEAKAKITVTRLPRIWGDEAQLAQLFQNLLVNSVRHSERESPEILVTATLSEGRWRFAVEDNGRGIPKEDRARIFLPYERLFRRDAAGSSGSGIGLATCKRIVERHGGAIWVEASSLGGARFCFTLAQARETQGPDETSTAEAFGV